MHLRKISFTAAPFGSAQETHSGIRPPPATDFVGICRIIARICLVCMYLQRTSVMAALFRSVQIRKLTRGRFLNPDFGRVSGRLLGRLRQEGIRSGWQGFRHPKLLNQETLSVALFEPETFGGNRATPLGGSETTDVAGICKMFARISLFCMNLQRISVRRPHSETPTPGNSLGGAF